jgi:hypothetical protein
MSAPVMEAGRELDQRVAIEVMGWTLYAGNRNYRQSGEPVPDYSTDIAAAWLVVEALLARGIYVCVEYASGRWNCWAGTVNVHAETAPLAICLAALKATEVRP